MWQLDERIAADTLLVHEDEQLQVRIMNDWRYEWLLLLPKVDGAVEIYDLPSELSTRINNLSPKVAKALTSERDHDKVNMGYLGNVVSQFHFHILGRNQADPAWPGPVWGHSPREGAEAPINNARISYWKAWFESND